MEHRLHLRLQVQVRDRLSDPVRDCGHAEHSRPPPVLLRYLNRPHRRRDVAPRGHPIPDLVEVPPEVRLERLDRLLVNTRSSPVGLDPSPCLPDQPLGNHKRLAVQVSARSPAPPAASRLTAQPSQDDPPPSLQPALPDLHRYHEAVRPCAPHRYSTPRGFSRLELSLPRTTAGPTAPLAARGRGTTGSHVPHQSPDQARATSMPDTAWPVSRHPPGSSRADMARPGFDVI